MRLFHKKPLSLEKRRWLWAYAFISPWLIGFAIFTLGPMLISLYYSFTDFNIVDGDDLTAHHHLLFSPENLHPRCCHYGN